jgi:hypothetical protein
MNDKKNILDKFLDGYDELNSRKKVNVETYYRPSKGKCIFGFIFCLMFMLILIRIFTFSIVFFFIFIGDLICLIYFGLNLFTKNGFVIKQKHLVPEEYLESDENEYEEELNDDDITNEDEE